MGSDATAFIVCHFLGMQVGETWCFLIGQASNGKLRQNIIFLRKLTNSQEGPGVGGVGVGEGRGKAAALVQCGNSQPLSSLILLSAVNR